MKILKNIIQVMLTIMIVLALPNNVLANEQVEAQLSDLNVAAKNKLSEELSAEVSSNISYNKFIETVENGEISKAFIEFDNYIYYIDNNEEMFSTPNPNSASLKEILLTNEVQILTVNDLVTMYEIENAYKVNKASGGFSVSDTTIMLFTFMGLPLLINIVLRSLLAKEETKALATQQAKDNKEIEEMKANAKTFNDVAGLKEVKEDLKTLVDFIVNGDKYREMGAELPRGVLLYGPSGTGKTLLARAIAGEAGVPFYHASGSDFAEKYVGVGASRIRDFFEKGKKNAPCILFIDEIDAICCKRGSDNENGEDRKMVNALLTAMDGFDKAGEVLVIGATNRLEDIDDAILRPGRFTNKYCVPLPESAEDRLSIIEIYANNKKFMDNVDLKHLAKQTIGCSPAEIESIVNEAAIIATRNGLIAIDNESIEEAFNKHIFKGHVRKDTVNRRKKELEIVAWHEAGHALVGLLLGEEVYKVSILSSTTGAGGATFTIPKKMGLHSVEDLKTQVLSLYAGRCAELLYANEDKEKVTTGASNDIERASDLIRTMVKNVGMNEEIGLLNLGVIGVNSEIILAESSKLAKELEEKCIKLLKDNFELLEKLANLLIEKETIYESDMNFINKRIKISNI